MCTRRRSSGQSVVELSIMLPLLLLILVGMADFALAYSTDVLIRGAVAEGGYYAAQNPDDEQGVRDLIKNELGDLQPALTDADISIVPCVTATGGPQIEITVTYDYQVLFGLAGSGSTITLRNGTTVPQFGNCD